MRLSRIFVNAPSLQAYRAGTRLTVYRRLNILLTLGVYNRLFLWIHPFVWGRSIWLVETEMLLCIRREILYSTILRQIVPKGGCAFRENFMTKIKIFQSSLLRFQWKSSLMELRCQGLRFWKREFQENYTARDRLRSRFLKCAPFSGIVRSLDVFPTSRIRDMSRAFWRVNSFSRSYTTITRVKQT